MQVCRSAHRLGDETVSVPVHQLEQSLRPTGLAHELLEGEATVLEAEIKEKVEETEADKTWCVPEPANIFSTSSLQQKL